LNLVLLPKWFFLGGFFFRAVVTFVFALRVFRRI
jgi:hypothetical protein